LRKETARKDVTGSTTETCGRDFLSLVLHLSNSNCIRQSPLGDYPAHEHYKNHCNCGTQSSADTG